MKALSQKVTPLISADHGDLVVPRVRSRFGCRSFRVSGPTIWNDLSVDIRSTDITREQFKRTVALRAGYLSVRTAEGASEKQSSLKARLRNGLTYFRGGTQQEGKVRR